MDMLMLFLCNGMERTRAQCRSVRAGVEGQIESGGKCGWSHGAHSESQSDFWNFLTEGSESARSAPG